MYSKSDKDGVAISAAADGVGALISDTKSQIVKSVSCPTADIIGILDLNKYMDTKKHDKYENELSYSNKVLNDLVEYGLLNIKRAKQQHDLLENYYVPNMDFEEVNKLKDIIIDRILEYK